MEKRVFNKAFWHKAVGLHKKPKRLNLKANKNGLFFCPIKECDSEAYKSQRGCRKHVYERHGWFYFFESKPNVYDVFPSEFTKQNSIVARKRAVTMDMPTFDKQCKVGKNFTMWLQTPGGGGKCLNQAEQICVKVLKYFKYCCDDVDKSWDIPEKVTNYCMGSVTLISEFVENLQETWHVGYSGVIGYANALCHMLDFRRSMGLDSANISAYISTEVYLDRMKKSLKKKMKITWNTVLTCEYLDSINCWATLQDMQKVIPFHGDRFSQILLNASNTTAIVPSHDLSFATAFLVVVLFILVKATRPMSYQYLTIEMVENLPKEGGIIDQTQFKTNYKYGFDSLVISENALDIIQGYIKCIRPRLNPACDFLLINRNGKQLSQLSNIFGRTVYLAIGKYIHPTRYRQIIETESLTRLDETEQAIITRDQKHSSNVAKIHYQKIQSQKTALSGRECMEKLNATASNTKDDDVHIPGNAVLQIPQNVANIGNVAFQITQKSQPKLTNNDSVTNENGGRKRERKELFSAHEDNFLTMGIRKYGKGKWTSILRDPEYSFHQTRKPATLMLRAKKLGLVGI